MNNHLFQDHAFGITTIDTGFSRPRLAASHLLLENHHAAFIDVGTNHSVPHLLEVLQIKNIPPENVDYVIVTHVHLDHAGGAGKLMQLFPNAHLVVHPRGARHLIDPAKLITGAMAVYGEEAFRVNYGDIVPVSADRVIQPGDKDTLEFQGRPLLFLDTPGHAKHHFCIFDERSKSFFTGDAFGISYRDFDTQGEVFIFATTTPVQFEPNEMHNSIVRLMSYQPEKMYLTHYGEVTNVLKLADKLHDSIDTQVTLMDAVTEEGGELNHDMLVESLWNYFWMELKQLGCPLPAKTCRELLAMDIELNAQGLEVWWQKG